eukprot:639006-Prymnesium_polylepis.1
MCAPPVYSDAAERRAVRESLWSADPVCSCAVARISLCARCRRGRGVIEWERRRLAVIRPIEWADRSCTSGRSFN